MRLIDVVERIDKLGDDDVIFAKKPWSQESDATIGQYDQDCRAPSSITAAGYEPLIERELIEEIIEPARFSKLTLKERCSFLIYYAENDAYPMWLFKDSRD